MSNRSKLKTPKKESRVYIPPTSNRGMTMAKLNCIKRNNYNIKGGRRP